MWQCMDCYGSDYKASLEKFDTLMGTEACDYSVDYSGYDFNYKINDMVICVNPIDCDKDIYPNNLCGKLLFRYINNNIMPYITKGKYYSTGKYIDGKYNYKCRRSRVMLEYKDNCPLTGMCYDFYLLKPIIDYYDTWCTYPENFSLEDLIEKCYNSFSRLGMRNMSIGLMMKMRYVKSFIIISMKIDSIMRMGMYMLDH